MIVLPNRKVGIEVFRNAKQQPHAAMHAAVPAEEHRNEASSAFPLALLQSHRSHTHAFARLTEPPGLALGLEQAENVVLANCILLLASGVPWGLFAVVAVFGVVSYLGP